MKHSMIFKQSAPGAIVKDVDQIKGIVSGYLSSFDNVDSDNDQIEKGSYAKTIAEWGPSGRGRIAYMKDHDYTRLIGKFLELQEDSFGLKFVGQLVQNSHGKDAMVEYANGLINEHSVRIQVLQSTKAAEGQRVIKEVRMWEGSAVTWGANSETPTLDVKAMIEDNDDGLNLVIKALHEKLDMLGKYIKIGEFSDEKLQIIEMEIKQTQSMLNSLNEPLADTHKAEEAEDLEKVAQFLTVYNLKLKNS